MTAVSRTTNVPQVANKQLTVILGTLLVAGVLLYALFTSGSDRMGSGTIAAIAVEPQSSGSLVGAGLWWP